MMDDEMGVQFGGRIRDLIQAARDNPPPRKSIPNVARYYDTIVGAEVLRQIQWNREQLIAAARHRDMMEALREVEITLAPPEWKP